MTIPKYPNDLNKVLKYTISGLEDSIFLNLCKIKIPTERLGKEINLKIIIPDKNGDKILTVSKYFDQAIKLAPSIIVGSPKPYFTIEKSDINPNYLNELETFHPYYQRILIKKVGLRIFEIIYPTICYFSIGRNLKVRIPGVIET